MASEQHSFYSARDNDDHDTSLLSYTQHANEKSTIGENNLRLNIGFNLLLIVANFFLASVEWFVYSTEIQPSKSTPEAVSMQFYVAIYSVRVEPNDTVLSSNDFLDQCIDLASTGQGSFVETCASIISMNRCFIAFLAIMTLQFVFHLHSTCTMYLIVKKRQAPPTAEVQQSLSRSDDANENNFDTESAQAQYQGARPENVLNQTQSSLETAKRSLASRLRINASWETTTWSLRAAIFL